MLRSFPRRADGQFDVLLSGETIACRSLDDAVAVKAADDILSGGDAATHPPVYVELLVRVLLRYGRMRAACLLSGSVVGLLSQCLASPPYAEETNSEWPPSSPQVARVNVVKDVI